MAQHHQGADAEPCTVAERTAHLRISFLRSIAIGPTEGDAIVRLVKQCPSLTSIDIGFNNLDQQMALGVLKAARPYDNITTLGFGSCKIHSAGAKQIADYVASSATVTSLDLEYK